MALYPPAMTYLGFQKAAMLQRYPSWAYSCWGKQGRQLSISVRPLCVPQLNSYFLSGNITDPEVRLWIHYFMEQHLLFLCEAYRKETGASLPVLTGFVISQVVQFCQGFSHQWTTWRNHSHNSTEIQRLLCMLGKQGVNRWSWISHCIETYTALLKAFLYVKKIGISCKLMFLVAVISKEKSLGVSGTAWGTSRREKNYKWSKVIQKVCAYFPKLSPQIRLTQQ